MLWCVLFLVVEESQHGVAPLLPECLFQSFLRLSTFLCSTSASLYVFYGWFAKSNLGRVCSLLRAVFGADSTGNFCFPVLPSVCREACWCSSWPSSELLYVDSLLGKFGKSRQGVGSVLCIFLLGPAFSPAVPDKL